jgi:hypothetical protein
MVWASDGIVSQPEPVTDDHPTLVVFGGIGFRAGGLAHDISEADREEMFSPVFAPEGRLPGEQSPDPGDLDETYIDYGEFLPNPDPAEDFLG